MGNWPIDDGSGTMSHHCMLTHQGPSSPLILYTHTSANAQLCFLLTYCSCGSTRFMRIVSNGSDEES